ncbi:hypothetical protein QYF61_004480 [Mycteria americana]|uniref:Uncharacterized protein n=1 Tax=Mycteria americana TaxID=33587 RepID=A0AAN7N8D5_MYCAM|nr:hypothetical protein QYF61_004480 [Mycteria americana]
MMREKPVIAMLKAPIFIGFMYMGFQLKVGLTIPLPHVFPLVTQEEPECATRHAPGAPFPSDLDRRGLTPWGAPDSQVSSKGSQLLGFLTFQLLTVSPIIPASEQPGSNPLTWLAAVIFLHVSKFFRGMEDSELHHLMVTAAKAAFDLHIPNEPLLLFYYGITESQNRIGWKRPLRSSSPTVNLTLPRPPLHHVPKHLIQTSFKYLQGWRLNHFPGQPVPMLDNPFSEEKFPNIQSKPPLAQLEAISSCPITCYLGEETNPHLSTTSFQVVEESDKVSPQPPFLQAKQSQLPQPLLIRQLLIIKPFVVRPFLLRSRRNPAPSLSLSLSPPPPPRCKTPADIGVVEVPHENRACKCEATSSCL